MTPQAAVPGLALVSRHSTRVRTLIAHEPPVLELLPDAAAQRAKTEEIIETFHHDGVGAAMAKFMANAGFDVSPEGAPAVSEPSSEQIAHGTRFLAHELRGTARYVPDIAALTRGPARVVVGIGAGFRGFTHLPHQHRADRTTRHTPGRVPRRSRRIHRATSRIREDPAHGVGGLKRRGPR